MSQTPCAALIATFRLMYADSINRSHEPVLVRLSTDPRVTGAWPILLRNAPSLINGGSFVYFLLQNKAIADSIHEAPAKRSEYADRMNELIRAAHLLSAYFEGIPISDEGDEVGVCDSAKQTNRDIRQCRASLDWAGRHLSSIHTLMDSNVFGRLPSSQKRSNPPVTFAVLMCDYFNDHIDHPLYELVSVLTEVVYDRAEPVSAGAVRKAWERHKERVDDSSVPRNDNRPVPGFA